MRGTLLERALEVSFRRAGARQPSTYSLLGEVFSKDDLSKLFPGNLGQKVSQKRKLEYFDIINKVPVHTAKSACYESVFPT